MTVVDGDRGVDARFKVGFMSGYEGGGFDDVDVRGPESRDDPSV